MRGSRKTSWDGLANILPRFRYQFAGKSLPPFPDQRRQLCFYSFASLGIGREIWHEQRQIRMDKLANLNFDTKTFLFLLHVWPRRVPPKGITRFVPTNCNRGGWHWLRVKAAKKDRLREESKEKKLGGTRKQKRTEKLPRFGETFFITFSYLWQTIRFSIFIFPWETLFTFRSFTLSLNLLFLLDARSLLSSSILFIFSLKASSSFGKQNHLEGFFSIFMS